MPDVPPLNGLVLIGGKSSRMGRAKHDIEYHEKPEWQRVQQLLAAFVATASISIAPEQADDFADTDTIVDHWNSIGPINGIASALQAHPDHAWLVVACDMPGLDADTISQLITLRNPESDATLYTDISGNFEPLCAIYEPSVLPALLNAINAGKYGLNRCLRNCTTHTLDLNTHDSLRNINTLQESETYRNDQVN